MPKLKSETYVRFKVISDNHNTANFFVQNLIPYTNSWNKWDEIITPNGLHTWIYQTNFWIMLNSWLWYSASIEEHLSNLFELLNPHMEILKSLLAEESMNGVFCVGMTRRNKDRIGISLDQKILLQIHQLKSEIDIDIL